MDSHQDPRTLLFELVASIPKGKVASYGWLGKQLALHPRHVGRLLHTNTDDTAVPCHRVVHADGSIASGYAFGGEGVQRERLQKEGVPFIGVKVAKTAFVQ